MKVNVEYLDGRYEYVDSQRLDELIELDQVKQFYRPSEEKWIDVNTDAVRGKRPFYRRRENRWENLDVEGQEAWEFRTWDGKERRERHYVL